MFRTNRTGTAVLALAIALGSTISITHAATTGGKGGQTGQNSSSGGNTDPGGGNDGGKDGGEGRGKGFGIPAILKSAKSNIPTCEPGGGDICTDAPVPPNVPPRTPPRVIPEPAFVVEYKDNDSTCIKLYNQITTQNMLVTVPRYNECIRRGGNE